jgi:serine/threonine protein kinase
MHQDNAAVGGCMSICDEKNNNGLFGTCNGINCCRTALPENLVTLNMTIQESSGLDVKLEDGCKHAFVASLGSFNDYENSLKLDDLDYLAGVVMVLDWWLISNRPYFSSPYSNGHCYENSYFSNNSSRNNGTKTQCSCKWPPNGNPYFGEGCQDMECIDQVSGYTCRTVPEEKSNLKTILISVFSGVIGLFILLIGAWWLYRVIKKRKDIALKQKFFRRNGGLLLQQQLSSGEVNVDKIKMYDSEELEKATDRFNINRILGQGGQGTVYKGMLVDGRIIAVKKSKEVVDEGQLGQFINEVVVLSQINHRNVVNLMGCCLETEVPLLVYEFIPNGTLFQYIHGQNEEFPLTWDRRLRIATEVGGALFYLHSAAALPIYHRDIKSTNILLDDKYRAKVADFGTSKSLAIDQTHVTTKVQGTFGYLDPEYFQSSQFTEKSDVYSFGVVLVELLTGQKAISLTRSEEGRSLATYFLLTMEANRLLDIVDPQVMKEDRRDEVMEVALLARRCLHLNGRNRPTMKQVTIELERIQKSPNSNDSQNYYEEIEYKAEDIVEAWDSVTSSTGSYFDSGVASLVETKPLFF